MSSGIWDDTNLEALSMLSAEKHDTHVALSMLAVEKLARKAHARYAVGKRERAPSEDTRPPLATAELRCSSEPVFPPSQTRCAVGALNEQSKRRHIYVSVYILIGGSASDALLSILTGGGLYHSGIEIEGIEYAFGGGPDNGSGIWRQLPRRASTIGFKDASYKESLYMGTTSPLTPAELHRVIFIIERQWRQNTYNILTRNWCVACEASQSPRTRPAGRSQPPPPSGVDSDCDAPTWSHPE